MIKRIINGPNKGRELVVDDSGNELDELFWLEGWKTKNKKAVKNIRKKLKKELNEEPTEEQVNEYILPSYIHQGMSDYDGMGKNDTVNSVTLSYFDNWEMYRVDKSLDHIDRSYFRKVIRRYLKKLPKKDRDFICKRFGLGGKKEFKLRHLSEEKDITISAVNFRVNKIINKLKEIIAKDLGDKL